MALSGLCEHACVCSMFIRAWLCVRASATVNASACVQGHVASECVRASAYAQVHSCECVQVRGCVSTVYSDFENYAGGIYHHVSGSQLGGARTHVKVRV